MTTQAERESAAPNAFSVRDSFDLVWTPWRNIGPRVGAARNSEEFIFLLVNNNTELGR